MKALPLLGMLLITLGMHPVLLAQQSGFERLVLTDKYYCDGVTAADINGDGKPDVIAGPFWYEGPDFGTANAFYQPHPLPPADSPSDSMFSFAHDLNADGHVDILVLGRVHKHEAKWYENPGPPLVGKSNSGQVPLWTSHFAFERVKGESPCMVDLDGDGIPQVICHWNDRWGSIQPNPDRPQDAWQFRPLGHVGDWPQFYHGQGVGDLNQDGKLDLIINDGWYQQPNQVAPLDATDNAETAFTEWKFHANRFSDQRGGAQMFAYDVDGDGDNDIITAKHAHEWGLAWYEHVKSDGQSHFREHLIMGDRSREAEFGIAFSQPHAMALGDIDGDGLLDIVTGKRRWAHGPTGDVEPNAEPLLCWFQLQRSKSGVRFVPHVIDRNSGVGVQVQAIDVNGDGATDVLTASKLGTFVFLNRMPQP